MDSCMSEAPKTPTIAYIADAPAATKDLPVTVSASPVIGLHPADLDNMLSLFPEMEQRIRVAARPQEGADPQEQIV